MTTSLIDADSLLAIDVGGVTTRAALFDVVDGRYRFLAAGSAMTTAQAPYFDIREGIRMALDELQVVTGRVLVGPDERLIVPSTVDGVGVDTVAATLSAGPVLRIVVLGLLEEVSLESARRLANTIYAQVVDEFYLNDRRKRATRIDTIMRLRPDVILAVGGTNGGASQSVINLLESVGLASYLLPREQRPEVLYAGNQALQEEVENSLRNLVSLHIAPNVRPALDVEQLDAAQAQLAAIYRSIRKRKLAGVQDLDDWTNGGLLPAASAFGRIARFLSKVYGSDKGVLGVDLGATALTLAGAFAGNLTQMVYPQFGLGEGLADLLKYTSVGEISRWLRHDIPEQGIREYLLTKSIYPASLPATVEELDLEQAIARQVMQLGLTRLGKVFPARVLRYGLKLLPWFEPILASGSVITRAPNLSQSLLLLLDGLQPTGVTTLVLDQNHIAASLGAAAVVNPLLAVQVLETNAFLNLGTVISPVVKARPGTPVLRVRMISSDESETALEVKQGNLDILPLPMGQPAQLQLTPLHRADVGLGGPGQGGGLRVVGGALGVIIDARGRPLRLPGDSVRRRELLNRWRWTLGC